MPTYQPFSSEWITFFIFLFIILGFVALSDIFRKKLKISGENTRQMVHIGVGLLVIISPFLFLSPVPPAVLALIFIVLNAIALKKDRMKGMHTTERQSYGTVFFPVTFLILILLYWKSDSVILITGMLIMTISDPLASIIGNTGKNKHPFRFWKDTKTLRGSLTVFVSVFIISTLVLYPIRLISSSPIPNITSLLITGIVVATVASLSEAISHAGSDNLTLPLFSALMLDIMQKLTFSEQMAVFGWVIFSFLLAFAAYRLKALTLGGAAGAMLLGSIVFSIGGIFWVVPMVTFFVLSSILSKIGKLRKTILKGLVEKGSNRDILQVFANGGISLIMAILYFYTHNETFYLMFLGSLAAATADTWGTEIGIFSPSEPRDIITFEKVPVGKSGGVTALGTSGFFMGAGILTLSGLFSLSESLMSLFIIIVISGILGALIDSVIGATIQAQYQCPNCNKITEKTIHCGTYPTKLISGVKWINNDVVNLACTSSGALIVLLLHHIFL
ncbi:MAG: hypothetical protein DRP89_00615 [Candidatus Neomarinimicrobiota bacterium]|nr:MAG: hypothetical protein DRP89_00615 [Candidatus Neomarinimicrobiota bacterium]